jgi:V/A-type H+/Na+-transporting ATPase subunit E
MGCKELIGSLRVAGDERLQALRAEAEQEAGRVRAEAARRINALREEHARKHAAEAGRHAEALMAEANAAVRAVGLRAERALAERLYDVARVSLHTLRNEGYRDVFTGFARELPRFAWQTVRVNPDDVALAREQFPEAEVLADPAIIGGMVAVSEGDRVRVVNTFEKRLESLWEDMLPDIMREVSGAGP